MNNFIFRTANAWLTWRRTPTRRKAINAKIRMYKVANIFMYNTDNIF